MGVLIGITFGLVVWLVAWALGVKGFDAFMVFILIALAAGGARMIAPYLPGNRDGGNRPSSGPASG